VSLQLRLSGKQNCVCSVPLTSVLAGFTLQPDDALTQSAIVACQLFDTLGLSLVCRDQWT
jgi:hypothetical protein